MTSPARPRRRFLLSSTTLAGTAWLGPAATPAWALPPAGSAAPARPRLVQLVDTAGTQQELARDYTTGLRLAWSLRTPADARLPELQTLPVDIRRAGHLQDTLRRLNDDPNVLGTVGMVGDTLAVEAVSLAQMAGWQLPHIAPWMSDSRHDALDAVLPLFPSRARQLRQAVASVRGMGIDRIAIVYPNAQERQQYGREVEAVAAGLGMKVDTLATTGTATLASLAPRLARLDSGLVLFMGAAPELSVLSQAMAEQRVHRFVLSLSDVDQGSLMQMPLGPGVPLILTQVVPNPASSSLPVVVDYRAALRRLYDEAPSPLSLAGHIAGLCALETCRRCGPGLGRKTLAAEVRRRAPMVLGGFRLDFNDGRRGSGFVAHTLLRPDGSLAG